MKKKIKKEEMQEEVKDSKKNQERQTRWIIGSMVFLIVIFVGFYLLIQWNNNKPIYFDYAGVRWYQEKTGKVTLYRGEFSLSTNPPFALSLRKNPLENNVSLNVKDWGFYREVITSYDKELEQCEDAVLAQFNLVYFLSGALKRQVTPAMFNQSQAEEKGLMFADCNSANDKTVILIRKSETPKISVDPWRKDCYIIEVGNCENFAANEKFMLGIIARLKNETIN